MLILQRKKNQAIMIGDDIEIIVTEVKGDHVKIGIRAPSHCSIYRKEIFEEIQTHNKASSTIESSALDQVDVIMMKQKAKVLPEKSDNKKNK